MKSLLIGTVLILTPIFAHAQSLTILWGGEPKTVIHSPAELPKAQTGYSPSFNPMPLPADVSPVSAAMPAPDMQPETTTPAVEIWQIKRGDSIHEIITKWAARANWQKPVWDEKVEDMIIQGDAEYQGEFMTVLKTFIDALPRTVKFRAIASTSNKLITIEAD